MRILWAFLLLIVAGVVVAQDESETLDSVTVTGSRVSYADLLDKPAVALVKPGDYLTLAVRLVNDTREAAKREKELRASLLALVRRAGSKVQVSTQFNGQNVVLTTGNLQFESAIDLAREDVSTVDVSLRVAIDPNRPGRVQADALRALVGKESAVGRTELNADNDIPVTISRPERFRYELIAAISADVAKLRETLEPSCKIALGNLGARVQWERASTAELLLYIPYSLSVSECTQAN